MLRAVLDPDSPFACVVVQDDGHLALAFRRTAAGPVAEVPLAATAPATVKLSRHGAVISLEAGKPGAPLQPAAALTVALPDEAYAGLAASSNTRARSFRTATLEEDGIVAAADRAVESTLETVDIDSGERRIVYRALQHFEAPNWTPDGRSLVFNSGGKIYSISVSGGAPQLIPTGEVRCNNDHGISPDGKWLAISGSLPRGQSQIFVVPIAGGEPRLVTPRMPSYWHGWSPDGKTLAYCASRDGEYDVYTIPVEGGVERRLTTAKGLDDGPEYSPSGSLIYFNSVRSGLMRIWAMDKDGANQRMISQGPEAADWFAHFSPDGKWIAYISYDKSVEGHPANKDVVLNLARADGSSPRRLVTLFGGQGTMNVPSWSPDGTRFAFVSYRLVKKR
ncbi:MAG: PD40 domain-containing protein [Acidobacteria bacterium]|nr:PD40 domain-containing protein [Acidobacteriota bacterium]